MKFALDDNPALYQIRSVSNDRIIINDTEIKHSVIVSAQTLTDWPARTLDALQPKHFEPVLAQNPRIVLLGVGDTLRFPEQALLSTFHTRQIGVEVMTTAAAARTFNMLASEGREVVAALML